MLIVMKEPMTIDFLKKGATANSASYCLHLMQYLPYILKDSCVCVCIYIEQDIQILEIDVICLYSVFDFNCKQDCYSKWPSILQYFSF